eukprot:m.845728 g.845728  ORF g.845728 m.845728 type:complete len:166 (-) comp23477_c1_seq48:1208-1705(-)
MWHCLWHVRSGGGRIFSNRQQGNAINLRVENVTVEDVFPSLNVFQLDLTSSIGSSATVHDVRFTNVHVRNFSTVRSCNAGNGCNCVPKCARGPLPTGIPNALWAGPDRTHNNISSMTFTNVSIGGVNLYDALTTAGYFNVTWESVHGITVDGKPVSGPAIPIHDY